MTEYNTYENKGHKIKYSKDWIVKEESYDVDVIFLAPMPPFASNVNVNKVELPADANEYTLDQYTQAGINEMQNVISKAGNFIIRKGVVSQKDARQVTFSGEQGKFKLRFLQVMILHDKKLYILTYTAEVSHFHENLDLVTEMIDSYEIK